MILVRLQCRFPVKNGGMGRMCQKIGYVGTMVQLAGKGCGRIKRNQQGTLFIIRTIPGEADSMATSGMANITTSASAIT